MIKRLPCSPVHMGKLGQNIFSEKSHRHTSNTNVKILPQNRKYVKKKATRVGTFEFCVRMSSYACS